MDKFRITYSITRALRVRMTNARNAQFRRAFSSSKKCLASRHKVLGIETSCDDTGAAVVDDLGNVLGDSLRSQTSTTVNMGGVLQSYAKALHEKHIQGVVQEALQQAQVTVPELSAVAVTVEPGMSLCLDVGLSYAKQLVAEHRVPMIPIHHMQAHALTVRMKEHVEFPFLVLLASGGHCLLTLARDVDDFLLLGTALDIAPGEAFDKVGRRLKLKTLYELEGMSFGAMIEHVAKNGDKDSFPAPSVSVTGCNFSFAGILSHYKKLIEEEERDQGVEGSQIISNYADLCASFQHSILSHLVKPIQRAFRYCDMYNLLPEHKTLVVSGGVACNQYLKSGLQTVCDVNEARLLVPPPKLCTDNGIMIAWNGMEKHLVGRGYADDPQSMDFKPKSPIGQDITAELIQLYIKVPNLKL